MASQISRDIDVIPNHEQDLVPIVLANTNDYAGLVFGDTTKFEQPRVGDPLILLVKADKDFYEGEAATDKDKNVLREGGVWHSLAVKGRALWHFRADAATTTIKGKLLTGS